jgi:alkanesulfonate monooxygenase SsuD/methylene tetrahydromethanopterin reductase-like flavin-dependent oxidoreductase (luciferase family)
VLKAEKIGLSFVSFMDHLHASPKPSQQDFLECWTLLSALATETSRVRLTPLVLNINNRNPALVAKMASSLDQISNGRLVLGIGAGGTNRASRQKQNGFEYEFDAYGVDFPMKPSTRIKRLSEGLEIIKLMWTSEKASYSGRHYKIQEAFCRPKPVQKPYPPILIGSIGGDLMMRQVARHADIWDYMRASNVEDLSKGRLILKKACSNVGRDPDDVKMSMRVTGTVDECIEKIDRLENEGLDQAVLVAPKGKETIFLQELGSRL